VLAPQFENPPLVAPPDVANTVARLARPYERPRTSSDCAPQLVEEYILETERAPNAVNANAPSGVFHIKLSILQRPSNQEYLGELYVDRDHVEGERNGSACRFLLGL
jgi:transcription factor SPT20 homolog